LPIGIFNTWAQQSNPLTLECFENLLLNKFHSDEILENLSGAILMSVTYQNICHTIRSSMPDNKGNNKITELRTKNIFDIYVTEYGTALTNILPILFLYLNTVTVTTGTFEP
jgi:hypothetical protein